MLETENETMMTQSNVSKTMVSEGDRLQYLQQLQDETTITLIPAMVFLIIVAITGLVGNSTILFVYSRKFQKNPTRILIMTIAALDLVANVFAIPGDIYNMLHVWDFNDVTLCRARKFMTTFATLCSALALLVVAVIRYRKVCKPHDWQVTNTQANVLSVIVALLGVLISIPYTITNGRLTKKTPRSDIFGCECNEDDYYKNTRWPLINNGFFLLLFCLSSVAITVMYVRIGINTWESNRLLRFSTSAPETRNRSDVSDFKLTRAGKLSVQSKLYKPAIDSNDDVSVCDSINKQSEIYRCFDKCLETCKSHINEVGVRVKQQNRNKLHDDMKKSTAKRASKELALAETGNYQLISHSINPHFSDYTIVNINLKQNTSGLCASSTSVFVIDGSRDVDKDFEGEKGIAHKRIIKKELSLMNTEIPRSSDRVMESVTLTSLDKQAQTAPEFCTNWREIDSARLSQGLRVLSLKILTEDGADGNVNIGETVVDTTVSFASSEIYHENSDFLLKSTLSTESEGRRQPFSEGLVEERTQKCLINTGFESNEVINKMDITSGDCENSGALITAEQSTNSVENIPIHSTNNGLKQNLLRIKYFGTNEKFQSDRKGNRLSYLGRTTIILISISTVFAISFLPFLALTFFEFLSPVTFNNINRTGRSLNNLFRRFYFINSAANPIIYSLCGGRFRRECASLLRCNFKGRCKR